MVIGSWHISINMRGWSWPPSCSHPSFSFMETFPLFCSGTWSLLCSNYRQWRFGNWINDFIFYLCTVTSCVFFCQCKPASGILMAALPDALPLQTISASIAVHLKIYFFSVCLVFHRRGKKHSLILRTQLSVRVHACIGEYQTVL